MMNENDVELEWEDTRAATVYQSVSGERSRAKPITFEQIMAMSEPGAADKLVANAKRVINLIVNDPVVPQAVREALESKKFIADLHNNKSKKVALQTCSTAMMPNYGCEYVIVGMFGSVWTDCRLHGKNARIGLDPNATEAMKAFYIDYAE